MSRLCALLGRHEGARGGRLLPGCGASGVGRSPIPDCPPSGRAAGAHYPLAVGAGGCGRGDPSPTPQRALLRAVGAAWGCPGGAPLAWVWHIRGRALSHPRLPAHWAGCRGPLPTGCGCGGVPAWGPVTKPTARALASWLCALWGRHEGALGGAPPAWLWGVRGWALSHPRLPALWAGCRGPLPTGCGCGGVRAWGPVTNPTARALASWLCALCGRHEGARGGCLLPGCGVSGVGRSPTPDCPPSGRPAGAHYPLAVGGGGPARVCVWMPSLAGSGGPASWARFGAPHLSFGRSWFALCLLGPLRAGVALLVVVVGFLWFLFLFLFPFSPSLRPRCLLLSGFPAPGALGLGVLLPRPPSSFFFPFFCPPPSLLSPAFPAFRLPWASAPPPFFFFPLVCVSCGVVLPCAAVLWCPVFFFCFSPCLCAGFLLFPVGSGVPIR